MGDICKKAGSTHPAGCHSILLKRFLNWVSVSLKGVKGVNGVSNVFLRGMADIHPH